MAELRSILFEAPRLRRSVFNEHQTAFESVATLQAGKRK
jgi:hypothetical protein